MSYIQKNLRQTATVFSRATADGYGGWTYNKSTVRCRWEDKQVLFVDASGQEKTSKAVIYVDTDVAVGSYILLGTTVSSYPPINSYEVKKFDKTPSLKATDFERKLTV